jgi:hypothetical protein
MWLAESLNIKPDEIQIVGIAPSEKGHQRVELEAPDRRFVLEMDGLGVSRMYRT